MNCRDGVDGGGGGGADAAGGEQGLETDIGGAGYTPVAAVQGEIGADPPFWQWAEFLR